MNRNLLWIFLVTAPLVSAGSLGNFQATCSGGLTEYGYYQGFCGGQWNSSFSFGGPFFPAGGSGPNQLEFGQPPAWIDFEVGTSGGNFTFMGDQCDYDKSNHSSCDGQIIITASAAAPLTDTGLSPGAVVSVTGSPGTAEGFFCDPCSGPPSQTTSPIFDIEVLATYQFTLNAPGTSAPFSAIGAEFTPVPESGTWVFAMLGLAGVATLFPARRRNSRARS